MLWFLVFCYAGSCNIPVEMPSKSACIMVGRQQAHLADHQSARFRCVGVKKEAP